MERLICTLLMRPWVQPFGGDGYCVWTYTPAPSEGLPWWIWALVVVLVLAVIALLLPRKPLTENDKIISLLNDLTPPYQDEARRNLTASQPSYEAEREYNALLGQIVHDGNGYKWKR